MKLLVDTHAFVWAVLEDRKLSHAARALWLDQTNQLLISPGSLWELAIKIGLGKFSLDRSTEEFFTTELATNQLQLLPITAAHAARVADLPRHHRDPFDRLLVAQALCEDVPLLSADAAFDVYGVRRVW